MPTRFVKGKARTETPRLKDTPLLEEDAGRQPSDGRDQHGHFAPGNQVGAGRGYKSVVREGLEELKDIDEALFRDAMTMYRAELRELPFDGAAVRQHVAAQCRHSVLGTYYANAALRAGLGTPEGMKLAECARSHDQTAMRLSVTAYDTAIKQANDRKKTEVVDPLALFEKKKDK